MLRENFNQGWMFYNARDKAKKTILNLPHDAMQFEDAKIWDKNHLNRYLAKVG